jgi:hypothetical protein
MVKSSFDFSSHFIDPKTLHEKRAFYFWAGIAGIFLSGGWGTQLTLSAETVHRQSPAQEKLASQGSYKN